MHIYIYMNKYKYIIYICIKTITVIDNNKLIYSFLLLVIKNEMTWIVSVWFAI